jgi:DNA-binding NarL/FixJ family response regulator
MRYETSSMAATPFMDGDQVSVEAGELALIGRERELALLDDALASLAAGGRPRVVVNGEPGIGKSALLLELGARARRRGLQVVAGAGDALGRDAPLGLVVDAFDGVLATLGDASLDRLGPARLGELARVLPSLAGRATPAARAGSGAALYGALAAGLEQVAADGAVVLVLDDVQWADDPSLSLIARLLRRPPRRVMPVLAHRSGDMPDLLVRAIGLTPATGEVLHLELSPLDHDAAAPLLDGLPPARGREVLRDSGGNPFYLSQLAGSARAADDDAPVALRAAIIAEVSALSTDARELVRAAAVLGDPFDPQLAGTVAQLPPYLATSALEELVRAELVRATERPERCAFRRPVIARIVRGWAGGAWCADAHRRAARLLAEAGAPALEQAPHVERSARPGDVASARLLEQAGAETLPSDPRAATRWFDAALRLLDGGGTPAERLRMLLHRAVAVASGGDALERAREPLVEAIELLSLVPPEQRPDALAPITRVESLLIRYPEASLLLRQAGTADAAELQLMLAVTHMHCGDWAATARTARMARDGVVRSGERLVRAEAAALLSFAESQLGRPGAARTALAEAEWAAEEDGALDSSPDALSYLAAASDALDRHEAAARYYARLLEIARTRGHDRFVVPALVGQAACQLRLGDLEAAERATREALHATHERDDPYTRLLAHAQRCRVATARGDVAEAVAHGEQAVAALERVPVVVYREMAPCFLATARLAAGDVDDAIEEMLRVGGGLALETIAPTWRTHWAGVLAEAELARGRPCAARAWSERSHAMAQAVGSAGAVAEAERTRAHVLLEDGDARRARIAAEAAAEGFTTIGRRLDAALASALLGQALVREGDRAAGIQQLRDAHQALAAAGAVRHREETARALRRLGQRVRTSGRAERPTRGAAALSRREREIAGLVALGSTNRQIADRLVISEKTVESHLTRIFTKLGVSSRTAAVHALAREDAAAER